MAHSRELPKDSPVLTVDKCQAPLALFDLDRTLYPGSSLHPLAKALRARGLIGNHALLSAVIGNLFFRTRGASDSFAQGVCERVLDTVKGHSVESMREAAEAAADDVVESVRPSMRSTLELHQRAGSFCVLLSASPQDLVARVAHRLGFQRAVGTVPEVVDGKYTGRLAGPFCYGTGKLARLEETLGEMDLSTAWAYADSPSDIPLMNECGNPVAVAPCKKMRREALERSWRIVDPGVGR